MKSMPKLAVLMYTMSTPIHLAKDPCSYAYYLAKECGYDASYVYFGEKPLHDVEFEKYCHLKYLGSESDFRKEIEVGKSWLKENARDLDVLMLFNYGTSTYRTANYAKKINPNIKIWCKLDMSEQGFAHFYDGSISRKIKSTIEYIKGRNVDLYTVENKQFFNILKKHIAFKNRLQYLPNCVSLRGVKEKICKKEENIVITVGRLGDWYKNNELLIEAIKKLPKEIVKKWKFYLVGPCTNDFNIYLSKEKDKDSEIFESIKIIGPIYDRNELYDLYSQAKIFILTSRSESFGIAAIEAMYNGAYPVLTNYGSITKDITDNGRVGKIVEKMDPESVADALQSTMTADIDYEQVKNYCNNNYNYIVWVKRLNKYIACI